MKVNKIFETELQKSWYTQGGNFAPIFLQASALSGFRMKKELGFGYESFLFNYKEDYGEMSYLNDDLERLWPIIQKKIKDEKYLPVIKRDYDKNFRAHRKLFRRIDSARFNTLNDLKILELLKDTIIAQADSVGIGHIIEPVGLHLEAEFKKQLFEEIKDKTQFNEYYLALSTPSKSSFIAEEENDLRAIKNLTGLKKKLALEKHLKKYSWIQNTYTGVNKITLKMLEKRLALLSTNKPLSENAALIKKKLISRHHFSKKMLKTIALIDFVTIWQDERKKNILFSINYLDKILQEIARRVKIEKNLLYYLGATEAQELTSTSELKKLKRRLYSRRKGCFFLMEKNRELAVEGNAYKKLVLLKEKLFRQGFKQSETELHGSIANRGTAIGKVKICKDLSSIRKVQKGDILVAPMTRPEYMPALRKAAAIVTDEGGITSHAAIVSRELNIPAVIGVKIATTVLRDGMIVEVRANHGVVRIIR